MLAKDKRKKQSPKKAEGWRIPGAMVFRMFIIGSVAIIACIWALWRHYYVPRTPLLVPIPSSSATEIPAPSLE